MIKRNPSQSRLILFCDNWHLRRQKSQPVWHHCLQALIIEDEYHQHHGGDLDDSARRVLMIAYGLSIINELLLSFPERFASPATELGINRG